jgi:hypothetical protein
MMGFVIGEHRPYVRQSQPIKLAIPLPCVLAVGPSVFEGKPVRFHREPPSNLPVHWTISHQTGATESGGKARGRLAPVAFAARKISPVALIVQIAEPRLRMFDRAAALRRSIPPNMMCANRIHNAGR